jgi:iron complex transport system substrate-binding protein
MALAAANTVPAFAQAGSPAGLAPDHTPRPGPVEYRDELGRRLLLHGIPQRIVSLAPSITETLFALDLGAHVAGVTNYCDYPAEALTRPRVGGPINPDLEQIVSLHPDLVVATRSLNRQETVTALEQLGVAVYTTDPRTVEEVIASTRRLGRILGADARGQALAASLEQRLAELAHRLAGHAPRRVFFVVWTDPIISTGPHTFLADALRHAGAESVVTADQDWPRINIEEVLRQNPEYLVFSGTHPDDPQSTINELSKRPGWSSLDAVRARHFAIVSDALSRPAPRIVDAIEELARQLHPDLFSAGPAAAGARPAAPKGVL